MRARKSLGQNFLVDGNLQRKIVEALDVGPTDEVLEIGPGRGALTRHLAGTVGRLVLVELDERLVAELRETWGGREDVVIEQGDFLELDRSVLVRDPEALVVVGNIPYNVTSPILFELLRRPRPARAVVMVQREVADRLLAPPGTSEYGALAVGVRSVARVERVLQVPRQVFRPVPGVDSTVVRILPFHPPRLLAREEERLRTLTRLVFQWRRKQMQKILRDHPDAGLPRADVEAVERAGGWDFEQRPETFSPEELSRMARMLVERGWAGGVGRVARGGGWG